MCCVAHDKPKLAGDEEVRIEMTGGEAVGHVVLRPLYSRQIHAAVEIGRLVMLLQRREARFMHSAGAESAQIEMDAWWSCSLN